MIAPTGKKVLPEEYIADDHFLVEQYTRIDNRIWQIKYWDRLQDVVKLASLNCELSVTEIYDKVKFIRIGAERVERV